MKTIIKSFFNDWLVFYFLRLFAFSKQGFFKFGLYFWTGGFGIIGRIAIGAVFLSGALALSHAEGLDVKIQPSVAELEQMSQAEDRRVSSSVSQAFGEIEEGLALFSEGALRGEEILNPLNIRSCGIVSDSHSLKKGELSDYWAQELIGSDLLREELEKYPPPAKPHFISVIDDVANSHDELVKNLISDEGPQAVLPELHDKILVFNIDLFEPLIKISAYKMTTRRIKQNPSSFINHSIHWNNQIIYESFESLSPPSILVNSSGNNFPEPIHGFMIQAAKDFGAILVGSLSPGALVSGFSQEGEEVAIVAPSDNYITSAIQGGDYEMLFGGTSGAAPLVMASLAGFEWLSGYHPSPEEAKLLLQRTALPTIHSHEKPRKNGAGMLNAYKLGMLGKRLKRRCQNKARSCFSEEIQKEESYHWALDEALSGDLRRAFPSCALGGKRIFESQPISCFSKETQNGESSHFPLDKGLREGLSQAFPSCALGEERISEGGSCEEKRETFHRLRKAVFLADEGREHLFQALSCIYKEAGFFENARGLDRLALALDSSEAVITALLEEIKSGSKNMRLLRALSNTQDTEAELQAFQLLSQSQGFRAREIIQALGWTGAQEEWKLLKQLSQDEDGEVRSSVARSVGELGSEDGLDILKRLSQDENEKVRSSVAQAVGEIGGEKGLALLEQMSQDKDGAVRSSTAQAVGEIGGEKGLALLEQMSQDKDGAVRSSTAQAVGEIGDEEGLALLEQMSQDEDGRVRSSVALAVGKIGSEKGLALLEQMSQDEDGRVRASVARSVGWMGDEKGLALLEQMSQDKNRWVRYSVALAVGKIGSEKGLALLEQMSQDKNRWVRYSVARSVGELGSEDGLDILKRMFQDEDGGVRSFVALSVGKIGSEKDLALLEQMSQDENGGVRSFVALSVGKIGSEKGLALLEQMSQDEDGGVRSSTAQAVGEIGSAKGLDILKRLSQDEDREVRASVSQAVSWMGDERSMELFAQMLIQERERRKQKR